MIDMQCPHCGATFADALLRGDTWAFEGVDYVAPNGPECLTCGTKLERVHLGKAALAISDEIPGGMLVYNGICNKDGSPRRYYSHSAMRKQAQKQGLVNCVEHKGRKGGDKSRHTSRWV